MGPSVQIHEPLEGIPKPPQVSCTIHISVLTLCVTGSRANLFMPASSQEMLNCYGGCIARLWGLSGSVFISWNHHLLCHVLLTKLLLCNVCLENAAELIGIG